MRMKSLISFITVHRFPPPVTPPLRIRCRSPFRFVRMCVCLCCLPPDTHSPISPHLPHPHSTTHPYTHPQPLAVAVRVPGEGGRESAPEDLHRHDPDQHRRELSAAAGGEVLGRQVSAPAGPAARVCQGANQPRALFTQKPRTGDTVVEPPHKHEHEHTHTHPHGNIYYTHDILNNRLDIY